MSKIFFIDDIILKFKCPSTDERIKDVVYLYNGILLSHKKNEIMPFPTTWMDLETIILSEVNQSEATQSCPTLGDPVDCSPPGSSVPGILQARILEWVAVPSSRGSSQARDGTQVSCTARDSLPSGPAGKPKTCMQVELSAQNQSHTLAI